MVCQKNMIGLTIIQRRFKEKLVKELNFNHLHLGQLELNMITMCLVKLVTCEMFNATL